MLKNTILVTLFLILSSILGFLAQIIYANYFGATKEMDIYFSLLSLPTVITGMASVVFTSVLLPNFAKLKNSEVDLQKYVTSLWGYVVVFSVIFSVVGFLLTLFNIDAVVKDLNADFKLTTYYVSILIWGGSGLFISSCFLGALLNYNKHFFKVAWTTILPALMMILFVVCLHKYLSIISIALGYFLSYLVQIIIFYKSLNKEFQLNKLQIIKIDNYKALIIQIWYVILSLLPFTIFVPIGYYWATYLEAGSVSFLGYSQSFSGFLSVATGMGIAIVSFPDLADDFANGNGESAMYRFEETLKYVLLISAFLASAFIALRIPILTLFYHHGSFNSDSVNKLASVVPYYLVAAIFIAGLNLLRTLYYSKGDYKVLAILGVIIPVLFFVLSGLLKNVFSFVGIGLANSLAIFVLFVLCVIFARKKSEKYSYKRFFVFCLKIFILSGISMLCTQYIFSILSIHLQMLFGIVVSSMFFTLIFYIVGRYIVNVTEVSQIVDLLRAKVQVRKK